GVPAVDTSLVAVLVPVLTVRDVTGIPLPRTDAMAFSLLVWCATLFVFWTALMSIALAVCGRTSRSWFSMEELASYWWLIAIGVFGTDSYELFSMWATRKKSYKIIAKTQFSQSLLGNMVKIGLGLFSVKTLGLIVGQVIAQSGGIGGYLKGILKDFKDLAPA